MRLLKISFLILFVVFAVSPQVMAQEDGGFERRLALAEKMQALNPARDQVNKAIDRYVAPMPPEDQEIYRAAMHNALDYKALEKISIDAYAETFSEAELAAMVEYYSKPEAISAREKQDDWGKKVYPEIVNMLDKAMMRVRTGGTSP